MNKTDIQLKKDIEAELFWDPRVDATQMIVSVDDGTVTLGGVVNTYGEKWAAEAALKRVSGVRALAQQLSVKLHIDHRRSDVEIASAVHRILTWNVSIPETVTAIVRNGVITLEGHVHWNHQRDAAEHATRHIKGVLALTNLIKLKPQTSAVLVKEQVLTALLRQASADADTIQVSSSGGEVTLSGSASSWQSIEDASNAAWGVSGVTRVVDHVRHIKPAKSHLNGVTH